MNWLTSVWGRAAAFQRLAEALEASVIDTGLTLLDQALEGVGTELNSESIPPGSHEEDALRLATKMRPLVAQLVQQRATLVLELRVLANRTGQLPRQAELPLAEAIPGEPGATWD